MRTNVMARTNTRPWDVTNYLKTDADQIAYLNVVFEEGDRKRIVEAIADVVSAKGLQPEVEEELRLRVAGTQTANHALRPLPATATGPVDWRILREPAVGSL